MAHPEQKIFVNAIKDRFPTYFSNCKVLEVGSMDINGSIRSEFSECDYTGLDVTAGAGVDIVGQGQLIDWPTSSADVTISCECMEHNPYWAETMANMFRITRPGGLVMMTCAGIGRAEHGTTRTRPNSSPGTVDLGWDYYCNVTPRDLERALALDWWFADYFTSQSFEHCDTFFVGLRKSENPADPAALGTLKEELQRIAEPKSANARIRKAVASLAGEPGFAVLRPLERFATKVRNRIGLGKTASG